MIEEIFNSMADSFVADTVAEVKSFYFSLGEVKKTVIVTPESCEVADGKTRDSADCVCKTSVEFFERIWVEGYRPGMADFLGGKIKSNDPSLLQVFLTCFGKDQG